MTLVIVGLVVVLLLAGGGGAFWYFTTDSAETDTVKPEKKKDTVSSYLRAPIHFEVRPLAVPIIRNDRLERYVMLQITLEMTDEEARAKVSRISAKLHDAYISSLYDYYSYVTPSEKGVNIAALKKRLIQETERTVGKGLVRSLEIKGALQRRSDRK